MKIVLAELNTDVMSTLVPLFPQLEMLCTFYYADNSHLSRMRTLAPKKFYFDSGVVQLRRASRISPGNRDITAQSLIEFCKKNADVVKYMFSLDIGDIEEQLKNAFEMLAAGVPVIPIWHGHMDKSVIDRFAEKTDYIAISMFKVGGISNKTRAKTFLDDFWAYLLKRNLFPRLRVHCLGVEQPKILLRYPFYSVDASSYNTAFRYGAIHKYDLASFKNVRAKYGRKNNEGLLRETGHRGLLTLRRDYKEQAVLSVKERMKAQDLITRVWATRGITWPED